MKDDVVGFDDDDDDLFFDDEAADLVNAVEAAYSSKVTMHGDDDEIAKPSANLILIGFST